ncbi:hypothetical protein ACMHYB_53860 [Sorangium sp. So ce1128]
MDFAIMSNVDRMGHGSRDFRGGGGGLRPGATRDSAAASDRRACDPAARGRMRRLRRAAKPTCQIHKSWTGRLLLV